MKLKEIPKVLYKSDLYRTLIYAKLPEKWTDMIKEGDKSISDYDPIKNFGLNPNIEIVPNDNVQYFFKEHRIHDFGILQDEFLNYLLTYEYWGIDSMAVFDCYNNFIFDVIQIFYEEYSSLSENKIVYELMVYFIPKLNSYEELWMMFKTFIRYDYKFDELFNLFLINDKVWVYYLDYLLDIKDGNTNLEFTQEPEFTQEQDLKIRKFKNEVYKYSLFTDMTYYGYTCQDDDCMFFNVLRPLYPKYLNKIN